jgi:hypothetical protein
VARRCLIFIHHLNAIVCLIYHFCAPFATTNEKNVFTIIWYCKTRDISGLILRLFICFLKQNFCVFVCLSLVCLYSLNKKIVLNSFKLDLFYFSAVNENSPKKCLKGCEQFFLLFSILIVDQKLIFRQTVYFEEKWNSDPEAIHLNVERLRFRIKTFPNSNLL